MRLSLALLCALACLPTRGPAATSPPPEDVLTVLAGQTLLLEYEADVIGRERVSEHSPAFMAHLAAQGATLPRHVAREARGLPRRRAPIRHRADGCR